MFKSLLIAFLLQLALSYAAKLQSPLQKESSNCQTTPFLQELLLRQEHKKNVTGEMKEKWREIFNVDDINRDGVITFEDRDKRIQIFIDIYTKDLVKTLREFFDCSYFSFDGKQIAIDVDEFVDKMESAYRKDSSKLLKKVRKCNKLYVPFIDANGDTRLSWQEYKDFHSRAYEIDTNALKTDFINWNPRLSADEFVDANDKNCDLEITWEEYKDFRNQSFEIATDELKDDFLDLNPHVSVEEVLDAWTVFIADDRIKNNHVQKEMTKDIFAKPNELPSR